MSERNERTTMPPLRRAAATILCVCACLVGGCAPSFDPDTTGHAAQSLDHCATTLCTYYLELADLHGDAYRTRVFVTGERKDVQTGGQRRPDVLRTDNIAARVAAVSMLGDLLRSTSDVRGGAGTGPASPSDRTGSVSNAATSPATTTSPSDAVVQFRASVKRITSDLSRGNAQNLRRVAFTDDLLKVFRNDVDEIERDVLQGPVSTAVEESWAYYDSFQEKASEVWRREALAQIGSLEQRYDRLRLVNLRGMMEGLEAVSSAAEAYLRSAGSPDDLPRLRSASERLEAVVQYNQGLLAQRHSSPNRG